MLRVHIPRLAGRYTEHTPIKLINILNEAPPLTGYLPRLQRVWAVEFIQIPTMGRNLVNSLISFPQHPPECLGGFSAGKAATDSNNSNRFLLNLLHSFFLHHNPYPGKHVGAEEKIYSPFASV